MTEEKKEITVLSPKKNPDANPRILLIAPHAPVVDYTKYEDEDDNTKFVAEEAYKELDCWAIINDAYLKKKIDFNRKKIVEKKYPEFLEYITDIVGLVGTPWHTLIIWIHGADNNKAEALANTIKSEDNPADIHAFIGYGQGLGPSVGEAERTGKRLENSFTARQETVEKFRSLLHDDGKGMNAVLAPDDAKNYRGRSPNNMNQWFREKGYPLEQVESIQIEIKKKGFRDDEETAKKTGGILGRALKSMLPVILPERVRAKRAFTYLKSLFLKHFHEAMLEAGRYIIEEFYGNNYEKAEVKKSKHKESLNQLILMLKNNSGDAPSKTWVYDAVNLAIDEHRFATFRTYGKIGHSHKVLLTHVKSMEEKKQLVEETAEQNFTVVRLRERIKQIKNQNQDAYITVEKVPADATLEQIEPKRLEILNDKLDRRIDETQKNLAQYQSDKKRVEKVITAKPKKNRKSRNYGFRDWTAPSCNVNIQTGCSNDCIYCYAKGQSYRRKQKELGTWADQIIRKDDVDKSRGLYHGLVGFPSTHDITDKNIEDFLVVLGKLLRAGNEVLIVSKPQPPCIEEICSACRFFKDKILFRFTIGAIDDKILGFWEPNAPSYADRKKALEFAHDKGFRTSVSIEPMLDSNHIQDLVKDLSPFVSEDIWIGVMNHLTEIGERGDEDLKARLKEIEAESTPEKLLEIYRLFENNPKIKWKSDTKTKIKKEEKEITRKAKADNSQNGNRADKKAAGEAETTNKANA